MRSECESGSSEEEKENCRMPVDGKNIRRMEWDQTSEGKKWKANGKKGISWICTACEKLETIFLDHAGPCGSLVEISGQSPYALVSDLCWPVCKKCYLIMYHSSSTLSCQILLLQFNCMQVDEILLVIHHSAHCYFCMLYVCESKSTSVHQCSGVQINLKVCCLETGES